MTIEFKCQAGHKLRVGDELAGKTVRCPKCSERLVVPAVGRGGVDASDSDVRPVEPSPRRSSKSARPIASSESRASRGTQSPKPGVHARDEGRPQQPVATSRPLLPKHIWFVIVGFGAAALLLIGVGGFIALKLASPQHAAPEAVAKHAPAARESAEPVETPAKLAAVKKTDAVPTPAKSSPAVADSQVEKPAQPEPIKSAPPEPATPSAGRARQTVQLPASMQQLHVGGSGKYLVAALPSIKKVAVVDVVAKQLVGFIPVDDNDFLVAAGETKVVVLQRTQGLISRYDLKSLKQELSVLCEPYPALAMGSSSEGPLLAIGTKIFAIDLQSLTPTVTKQNISYQNSSVSAVRMVASATGGVFIIWKTNSTPITMTVFEVRNGQLELAAAYDVYGAISPSPDGQFIYAAAGREGPGRLDVKCKWIGNDRWAAQALRLPAATGPFCLVVRDYFAQPHPRSLSLAIHTPGDNQPILTVPDVVLPESRLTGAFPIRAMLPPDRCLFWMPIADAIVTVPNGDDQLVIQHFNLKEELEQKGVDYFRVTSVPPRVFQRGQKLSYPMEVFSKQGGVQYSLQNGPPGATVSKDGLVSWNVPADFSPHEAFLLVNLRDGSGQQLSHVIKLTDGQSTPTSQQRTVVERRTVRTPSGRIITTTVSTGVAGPVTSPPKSAGTNVWHWTGGSAVPVRTEKGSFGGIVLGDALYLLKDNGALSTEPVKLPGIYLYAGLRANGVIGLAANPTRIEVLDRHGKLLRKVSLENVAPTGLALHPTKPICYVGLDRSVPPFRGAFVVVDEQAAKFTAGDEDLGQDLVVDPSGRFLVSTYVHRVHVGDEIVVTGSSRRGSIRGRGRSVGPSGPPPRVGVVHRFAHVAVMLVYDLDSPLLPESHSFSPLSSPPGPMRISSDGRRVTTHVPGGRVAKVSACNPLDFKAASIDYAYGVAGGGGLSGSDVAFHPTLPLGAIVAAPTAAFFDPETGKPTSTKELLDLPELTNLSVRRAMFSSDGKQLVILATDNKGENTLLRASLSLSSDQQAALKRRAAASPLKSLKSAAPPLAELTAWRGGLPKPATSAQIVADYSDSVVIVRTENSTGTGFFVGTSGLVLTCAHCVSPMDKVKVIYHPQGKPDEKNTTEAVIAYRDRKTDLALLKIKVTKPVHPVVLADPIEVKSGEDVTIIANPGMGTEVLDNTVTTGIISNAKRMIVGNPYIQSSAAVNPGSSGGPMFDRNGHVIGVVVLKAGIEGVGFAVPPMSIARFLLKATRHDTKQGLLERAWVDAAMKAEIPGGLMRVEKGSVTLVDKQSGQPKTLHISDFSPGDQKLLALLATGD